MKIFSRKILIFFLFFAQNIDRKGGSNGYPQSMFWSKNEKKVYPCKPQFYYMKLGFKGVYIARICFLMLNRWYPLCSFKMISPALVVLGCGCCLWISAVTLLISSQTPGRTPYVLLNHSILNEPENRFNGYAKTKAVSAQLIGAFVFATRMVQSLPFLNI